jgi:hypothetical protein
MEGGRMTTRRELLFAALICFPATFVPALPEKAGALEVTYYYLPG